MTKTQVGPLLYPLRHIKQKKPR
ncbi:unnamed protein product [Acanthoscelides obtectus]|uniref:Uncharacterized protein n=1 Tax=Acanthoscelides obtectus TaxID=200917 RepID=A0A9P0KQ18_ACAOB|nr:unnamed protein product [Acanthoscelides obtectus]CAK1660705.1 hypothetical protein AOBTE_LOCUS22226 [Acanthoscelides obtectus]